MVSEKRSEGGQLGPASQEFAGRVVQKTTDIRAAKGHAAEAQVEQHLDGICQMLPDRAVVAGPSQSVALNPGVAGARDDERAGAGPVFERSFAGGARHF